MTIFKRPSLKFGSKRRNEMPEGLWTKCPECGEMIHHLKLEVLVVDDLEKEHPAELFQALRIAVGAGVLAHDVLNAFDDV